MTASGVDLFDLRVAVGAGLLVLLASATAAGRAYDRRWPSAESHTTRRRIRTWWALAVLSYLAWVSGPAGLAALMLAGGLLYLREFVTLDRTLPRQRPVLWGLGAAAAVYHVALLAGAGGWIALAPLPAGLLVGLITRRPGAALRAAAAFLLAVGGLGCVVALAQRAEGPAWVFLLLLLTGLNDVAQYLWGKALGGPRVAPRISPNKTWAGLAGGVCTTALLAALLAPAVLPVGRAAAGAGGALLGLGGFAGDLAASAYKRSVGAGASGRLLPGHGGAMDRLDSLCVTAPLLYGLVHLL